MAREEKGKGLVGFAEEHPLLTVLGGLAVLDKLDKNSRIRAEEIIRNLQLNNMVMESKYDELLEKFDKLLFLQEHPGKTVEDYIDENGNIVVSDYRREIVRQELREKELREKAQREAEKRERAEAEKREKAQREAEKRERAEAEKRERVNAILGRTETAEKVQIKGLKIVEAEGSFKAFMKWVFVIFLFLFFWFFVTAYVGMNLEKMGVSDSDIWGPACGLVVAVGIAWLVHRGLFKKGKNKEKTGSSQTWGGGRSLAIPSEFLPPHERGSSSVEKGESETKPLG